MGLGSWTRNHLLATTLCTLIAGLFALVSVLGVLAWGLRPSS